MDDVRLPSVERTVDVIQLLSSSTRSLTLAEICRATGIPKSSAHYLIQTLLARGYLYRNLDGRTYSIGMRVPEFADASDAVRDLRNVLQGDLGQIARILGLTSVVTVLKGAEAVIIEKKNSPDKESTGNWGNWVGRHIDVHCTAQGKIHLAYLAEPELDALLKDRTLARFTPRTIWSIRTLKTHLERVRSAGFAFNDEEHIIGIRGVAAPIFSHVGCAIAAIGVTGSIKEIPREHIPYIAKRVIASASEISRRFLDHFPTHLFAGPHINSV